MSGLFGGLPIATAAQRAKAAIPADTELPNGQSPQSVLIPLQDIASQASFGVTITVGAAVTNVAPVNITLTNADGTAWNKGVTQYKLYLFADGTLAALANGGSTGLAADAAHGFIAATPTAKKVFDIVTDANGVFTGTWTDTGTTNYYLALSVGPGAGFVSDGVVHHN